MLVCASTACQIELNRGHYRIWNLGTNKYRVYCPSCGRKIVEYNNSGPEDELKLKFQRVRPDGSIMDDDVAHNLEVVWAAQKGD